MAKDSRFKGMDAGAIERHETALRRIADLEAAAGPENPAVIEAEGKATKATRLAEHMRETLKTRSIEVAEMLAEVANITTQLGACLGPYQAAIADALTEHPEITGHVDALAEKLEAARIERDAHDGIARHRLAKMTEQAEMIDDLTVKVAALEWKLRNGCPPKFVVAWFTALDKKKINSEHLAAFVNRVGRWTSDQRFAGVAAAKDSEYEELILMRLVPETETPDEAKAEAQVGA